MVDAPERIWTIGSGRYAFDEPHMRDGVAATEYVRVDLLTGPCGYLHMPIGLAEDSWSLEVDPSEYPDEVASAPLYMIDPTLSDAVAEREAEPVAWQHPDDLAVDRFAAAMKAKLAKKRAEGCGGWDNPAECSAGYLSLLLVEHIEKGDPLDVGNLAMMLHQRGERIVIDDEARGVMPSATSELEALRKRVAELEKALEPFALVAEHDIGESEADDGLFRPMERHNRAPRLTVGHLRAARRVREGGNVDG